MATYVCTVFGTNMYHRINGYNILHLSVAPKHLPIPRVFPFFPRQSNFLLFRHMHSTTVSVTNAAATEAVTTDAAMATTVPPEAIMMTVTGEWDGVTGWEGVTGDGWVIADESSEDGGGDITNANDVSR